MKNSDVLRCFPRERGRDGEREREREREGVREKETEREGEKEKN